MPITTNEPNTQMHVSSIQKTVIKSHMQNFTCKVLLLKLLDPTFYNNPGKNSCKKNIRPRSWDTYSKLNGGKNILVGVHFGYYG